MRIEKQSGLTGKIHIREIPINVKDYLYWERNRENILVQNMFPNLSANDREFLMTGITEDEWDELFDE